MARDGPATPACFLPDPDGNISIWMRCGAPLNWTGWCNPTLDAALDAGAAASDDAGRAAAYRRAADTGLRLQVLDRREQPGQQGAGDDHLLQPAMGEVGQVAAGRQAGWVRQAGQMRPCVQAYPHRVPIAVRRYAKAPPHGEVSRIVIFHRGL